MHASPGPEGVSEVKLRVELGPSHRAYHFEEGIQQMTHFAYFSIVPTGFCIGFFFAKERC